MKCRAQQALKKWRKKEKEAAKQAESPAVAPNSVLERGVAALERIAWAAERIAMAAVGAL